MILGDLIKEENIFFTNDCEDKKDAIFKLSKIAEKLGKVANGDDFAESVYEREMIVSTGIGLGVAIPHSKLNDISNFFIVVGILNKELDWDAIDKQPVKAVFLIGGPQNEQKKYLKILSKLMLLIKKTERRENIFNSTDPIEIVELFEKF